MSAILAPYGLAVVLHPSGIVRPAVSGGPQPYGGITIASGLATNIFLNSPVQIDSTTPSGNLVLATGQQTSGAVTAAGRILGTFQGCEFTLTATGRRTVSNYWPANTVATQIVGWATRDPWLIYEIQANGPVAATALGAQGTLTTNGSANGNTTTGFSTVALDTITIPLTQASTNQLRIVGFSQRIDNLPGDAFTVVQVQIAAHQDVANQTAY